MIYQKIPNNLNKHFNSFQTLFRSLKMKRWNLVRKNRQILIMLSKHHHQHWPIRPQSPLLRVPYLQDHHLNNIMERVVKCIQIWLQNSCTWLTAMNFQLSRTKMGPSASNHRPKLALTTAFTPPIAKVNPPHSTTNPTRPTSVTLTARSKFETTPSSPFPQTLPSRSCTPWVPTLTQDPRTSWSGTTTPWLLSKRPKASVNHIHFRILRDQWCHREV